jgi:hypothetical protein
MRYLVFASALILCGSAPAQFTDVDLDAVERKLDAAKQAQVAKEAAAKREAEQRATAEAAARRIREQQAADAAATEARMATLLFRTDAPCNLSINGMSQGALGAGETKSVKVIPGDHIVDCVSTESSSASISEITTATSGAQSVVILNMTARLQQLRQESFGATGLPERGYLGVSFHELSGPLAELHGLDRPRGAFVAGVEPDSPAHKAGINVGDIVLTYNGKQLEASNDLPPLVGATPVGSVATIQVLRDRLIRDLTVTIGRSLSASERFTKVADGVADRLTQLVWASADNGSDIDWNGARNYCASMGSGWSLPTVAQLQGLVDSSGTLSQSCGVSTCRVTPSIRLSGSWFWSGESNGSAWASYVFLYEGDRLSFPVGVASDGRALCVRRS